MIAAANDGGLTARTQRVLCAAVVAVSLSLVASTEAAPVPKRFFGIVPQGELAPRDFERMEGVVGTLRVPFYWFQIEPRPGVYDFARIDTLVRAAADRGIRVLPFVCGSPAWLTGDASRPPHRTARGQAGWADLLRRLVGRYGPHGSLWGERRPRYAIRRWQIWNEPNFVLFWRPRPSPSGYARLLELSAHVIRRADPRARIVTAGVAPVEGGALPWVYLHRLYRVPGVEASFDAVGLHPYASSLRSLAFQVVQARRAMASAGDLPTPLEVTEFGVASDGARISPMVKTPSRQAGFLTRAYRLLLGNRKRWRLGGASWFSWRDGPFIDPYCVFCQHAGLFDLQGAAKPAWRAYARMSATATRNVVR